MVWKISLEERTRQLKQAKTQIPGTLVWAGMSAALRAIEKAVKEAPPTVNSLRETNTRTGEMKQHWITDSHPRPIRQGNSYVSGLNSDEQYTSFVNDGHRVDRHFVPGLIINPGSGLLELDPDGTGGIMVGTRMAYIPGLFTVDRAVEKYRRIPREELKGLKELMK